MPANQPSYVRRALRNPSRPRLCWAVASPSSARHLFDTPFNGALTTGVIVALVVWPAAKFLFIDAVWEGTSESIAYRKPSDARLAPAGPSSKPSFRS